MMWCECDDEWMLCENEENEWMWMVIMNEWMNVNEWWMWMCNECVMWNDECECE